MNRLDTLLTNIHTPNLAKALSNQTSIQQPTDRGATGFPPLE
jgi:hypothetical protein